MQERLPITAPAVTPGANRHGEPRWSVRVTPTNGLQRPTRPGLGSRREGRVGAIRHGVTQEQVAEDPGSGMAPCTPGTERWVRRGWVLAALSVAVVAVLTTSRGRGPSAVGSDAPSEVFSAARARATLQRIIGTEPIPRPTGSLEHERASAQLFTELLALGVSAERHSEFVCGRVGMCARVTNVLARVPATTGALDAKAVVLTAHYDTVGASPGVSDDGAGVAAVLESVRALLAAGGQRNHDLIVLLTDGEEIGLLGAEAFTSSHRWAADAVYYINLEARGTRGPSYLFEMIGDERLTLEHYAGSAPRPATSSAYVEIYRLLPNLTDMSVYGETLSSGANLGYIGHVQGYHTPRDDFDHLDMGSLQHHGDNALALVRALMTAETLSPERSSQGSVFVDVLQLGVLRVSVPWARALAWLALVALLVGGLWAAPRDTYARWRLLGAVLGWIAVLLVTTALAFALDKALRVVTGSPAPWWSALDRVVAMHWLVALALTLGLGGVLRRACGAFATWWGWWALNAAVGLAVMYLAPGFGFLWLWPSLAAALVVFGAGRSPGDRVHPAVWASPASVLLLLWLPIAAGLVDAVGAMYGAVVSLPAVAVVASLLAGAPSFPRRAQVAVAAAAVIGVAVAMAAPVSSDLGRPSISLVGVSPTGAAASSAGVYMLAPPMNLQGEVLPVPLELAEGAEERRLEVLASWSLTAGFHRMDLPPRPPPQVEVVRHSGGSADVRVRSVHPLANFRLRSRSGVIRRVGLATGASMVPVSGPGIGVRGVPGREGLRVEVDTRVGTEIDVYDVTFGLPEGALLGGAPMVTVRDAVARPFQTGDLFLSGGVVDLGALLAAPPRLE